MFSEILAGDDTFKFYTDGEWKTSTSGKTVNIINPSTLKPVFKVQGVFAFLEGILYLRKLWKSFQETTYCQFFFLLGIDWSACLFVSERERGKRCEEICGTGRVSSSCCVCSDICLSSLVSQVEELLREWKGYMCSWRWRAHLSLSAMLESQMVDLSKVSFDLTLKIRSKRSCLIGFTSSFTFSHLVTKLMSSLDWKQVVVPPCFFLTVQLLWILLLAYVCHHHHLNKCWKEIWFCIMMRQP